jgi:hypothetical protein
MVSLNESRFDAAKVISPLEILGICIYRWDSGHRSVGFTSFADSTAYAVVVAILVAIAANFAALFGN